MAATDLTNAPVANDGFPAAKPTEPGISHLVGGILEDAQRLIEQQFQLLKIDLRKDLLRFRDGGIMLAIGAGCLAVAGLLLLFTLVHLLEWLTRPYLEMWACYGLVAGFAALVGGTVAFFGAKRIEKLKIVPEQASQGLEENLQWKTNRR